MWDFFCTFAPAKVFTMEDNFAIQLFEGKKVRLVWDAEQEKYYFSVVDIVQVLTGSDNPQVYWRVLKKRLHDEGNETVTNCNALKLPAADGKKRLTDVADLLRLKINPKTKTKTNNSQKIPKNGIQIYVCHFFVVTLRHHLAYLADSEPTVSRRSRLR